MLACVASIDATIHNPQPYLPALKDRIHGLGPCAFPAFGSRFF